MVKKQESKQTNMYRKKTLGFVIERVTRLFKLIWTKHINSIVTLQMPNARLVVKLGLGFAAFLFAAIISLFVFDLFYWLSIGFDPFEQIQRLGVVDFMYYSLDHCSKVWWAYWFVSLYNNSTSEATASLINYSTYALWYGNTNTSYMVFVLLHYAGA